MTILLACLYTLLCVQVLHLIVFICTPKEQSLSWSSWLYWPDGGIVCAILHLLKRKGGK